VDTAEKRGFIIDFGYEIPPELMKWFLFGTGQEKQELPPVYKLMVKPDIIDGNASTLYICSTDSKVYVSGSIRYERTKSLNDIITAILENKDQQYRDYSTFNSANIYKGSETELDVLFVTASPSYWPYFEYSCEPPARAEIRDELLAAVLGAEKGRYNMKKYNDNMKFTYGSNIYRYYNDGYLTYNYLGSVDTSGNVEADSLLNAYKFLARVKGILESSADIVLTSVEEKPTGVFSFTFDYRLKGMPVQVGLYLKDGNGKKLEHAIIIQADSKRVLSCDWLLRDFTQNGKAYYNDRFTDVVGKTGMNYEELVIRDMRSGYLIDSSSDGILKPKLLIERKDSPLLPIEMLPQEGD